MPGKRALGLPFSANAHQFSHIFGTGMAGFA